MSTDYNAVGYPGRKCFLPLNRFLDLTYFPSNFYWQLIDLGRNFCNVLPKVEPIQNTSRGTLCSSCGIPEWE